MASANYEEYRSSGQLRPAEPRDAEATWASRQLPEFSQWMARAPTISAQYAAQFVQPESLRKTLVIELDDTVVGDLMVSVQDAWAQDEVTERAHGVQADLGCGLDPNTAAAGTRPRRSARYSGSASQTSDCVASPPTASLPTSRPGG